MNLLCQEEEKRQKKPFFVIFFKSSAHLVFRCVLQYLDLQILISSTKKVFQVNLHYTAAILIVSLKMNWEHARTTLLTALFPMTNVVKQTKLSNS